ncbi:MAG: hypothetical protein Q7S16_03725 [bacterium]|nr:hypothetical protein [bacterium]
MTDQLDDSIAGETFDTGTSVHAGGVYVCSPCGYKKKLEPGDTFPECDSCMKKSGSDEEEEGPAPSGIWEYVGADEEKE